MISFAVKVQQGNATKKVIISAQDRQKAALKVCLVEKCNPEEIKGIKALIPIKKKMFLGV